MWTMQKALFQCLYTYSPQVGVQLFGHQLVDYLNFWTTGCGRFTMIIIIREVCAYV